MAGLLRTFSAALPPTGLGVPQGQILRKDFYRFTGEAHLIWGDLNAFDPTRDDAIQIIPDNGRYYGYDAHPVPGYWYFWFSNGIAPLKAALGL